MNNCTTRVELKIYRDCSGASTVTNNITWNPITAGCSAPTPISAWSTQVTTEVTPLCPTIVTQCSSPNAPVNGVEEYSWFRDYDICSQPNCEFEVAWSTCCRNAAITSLANASSNSMYNYMTVNTGVTPCNNSPVYTRLPLFYACNGQSYNVHQGAFDPDGDSLVFSLSPCYNTNSSTPVTYSTGYSPTQPLGPTWNVSLDPVSGMLTILPNPGSLVVGVVCIQVEEYRNGQLIATNMRDVQVIIISCPPNNNPA
ncbi:MAG: hypothetical protein AAF570_07140, partial [Bacteroidota bacterium]